MNPAMKIANTMNDAILLTELGKRLEQIRLERGTTQDTLAERAGIGKRTLERLEAGESVQITSLLRVLRELELLEGIETWLPEPAPRPMDLLRLQGKKRQRAYAPRPSAKKAAENAAELAPREPWTWGDEK